MIRGTFNEDDGAIITLWVRGLSGIVIQADFTVNTGLSAEMTLPRRDIEALALVADEDVTEPLELATGQEVECPVFRGVVTSNSTVRMHRILASDGPRFVGRGFIRNRVLNIQGVPDGIVSIDPLP